ncbi:exo-alpha-sialidase [Duganella sp. FT80W]|uniref:Exo-alpha-sialidase n=1 Tax=Duganella guangzhouensis TaxID=2666084 RepID=A0A6I2L3X7_9BURK|nr:cellulose binding domain-containing protein [Duganella guangzhouensis]MRW91857.1 exo-alpha-sialidase [Duganella guangzhouensis]
MKAQHGLALLMAALVMPLACTAENYRWDAVAMGGGGFVTGVIPSKSERGVVYARTDVGGAYRWDQNSARWIPLTDWIGEADIGLLGIESLAVDPRNAANVYLLAGTSYFSNGKTAILRSSDYGKNFTVIDVSSQFKAHGNGMGRQNGEKLQVDPGASNVLYTGTRRNGLYRSSDYGATWNRLAGLDLTTTPNDNGISFVLLDPTSATAGAAKRIFVGVSRLASVGPNLYFSADGGATFTAVKGGPTTALMPQRAAISSKGKLYITYANGAGPYPVTGEPMDNGQIWEYNAVGGNWANITPAGAAHPYSGISVDPANPKHLVASTINTWLPQGANSYGDRVYTSLDAGRSWTDVVARGFALDGAGVGWISNGASIHWAGAIEFDPFDAKNVWVGSGNGLFKTANIDAATTTWAFDVAGIEETVPFNFEAVPNGPLVSVIGDFDGFLNTDPAQYGIQHSPQMGTTSGLAVAALDGRIMARAGSSLYYSSNGGASWNKSAVINGAQGQLALSADGYVLLHSPADSTTSYRSTNYGGSWTPVTGLAVNNARPVADPVNPAKFYAYDGGSLLASVDGGVSFVAKGSPGSGGSSIIRVAPGREGDVWVCLNGGGLTRSTDSGASFSKIASVNQCGAIGFGKAAPASSYPTLYMIGTVGTTQGVLRSTDAGATWVRVNDDAHQYGGSGNAHMINGDTNVYGRVYMSTAGRGIAYGQVDDSGDVAVTAVANGPGTSQPVNQCSYVVTAAWQGGYNAAVRITNNRSTVISGWSVTWTYTDNSVVQGYWNAAVTGSSPTYTATPNQSWNHDIYPGNTVEFGMTVSGSAIPVVTGDACN